MTTFVCVSKYFDAQIRSKRKKLDKTMSYDSRGSQETPNATRGSQERRRATPEDFAFGKAIEFISQVTQLSWQHFQIHVFVNSPT